MSAPKSFDQLIADYDVWLRGQSLPPMCARELLLENITEGQRRWLSVYVLEWEARENLEDERNAAYAAAKADAWEGVQA